MSPRGLLGLSIALFLWVGPGLAGPIAISNPSFENPSCGAVAPATCAPAGWVVTALPGAVVGELLPISSAWDTIPDGVQVAFSNGGTLTQGLGVNIAPGSTYTLSVWVSRRSTAGQSFTPEIQLLGGSTALFTMNNSNPGGTAPTQNTDGTFKWVDWSMSFTSPSSGAIIGQPLSISLGSDGIQTDFDNVSLTAAVPEPGMFALIGGGLIALVLRRRLAK
jgi:PEP-CTERM motif